MARDSQRAKVYRSEVYRIEDGLDGFLPHWEAVLQWHERVTTGPIGDLIERTFRMEAGELAKVSIRQTRGSDTRSTSSYASFSRIRLGNGSHRSKQVHLHELAHCVTDRVYGWGWRDSPAPHGPEWTGVLLRLVLIVHGEKARCELGAGFSRGRVKVKHWTRKIRAPYRQAA